MLVKNREFPISKRQTLTRNALSTTTTKIAAQRSLCCLLLDWVGLFPSCLLFLFLLAGLFLAK